ncbi:unnamed protein product [Cutaneotrichosporon oleaginosum]
MTRYQQVLRYGPGYRVHCPLQAPPLYPDDVDVSPPALVRTEAPVRASSLDEDSDSARRFLSGLGCNSRNMRQVEAHPIDPASENSTYSCEPGGVLNSTCPPASATQLISRTPFTMPTVTQTESAETRRSASSAMSGLRIRLEQTTPHGLGELLPARSPGPAQRISPHPSQSFPAQPSAPTASSPTHAERCPAKPRPAVLFSINGWCEHHNAPQRPAE